MRGLSLITALGIAMLGSGEPIATQPLKEPTMLHATGTFDVKIIPLTPDNAAATSAGIGRNAIEKQFHGDIVGSSTAEMLYSGNPNDSGAYVALEKVTGTVQGRKGSFMLIHSGVMNRGTPQDWVVRIVPDSGTDELAGIRGECKILISGGQHSYELTYELPHK